MKTPLCTAKPVLDLYKLLNASFLACRSKLEPNPGHRQPLHHRGAPAISLHLSCSHAGSCYLTQKNALVDFFKALQVWFASLWPGLMNSPLTAAASPALSILCQHSHLYSTKDRRGNKRWNTGLLAQKLRRKGEESGI